MLNNFSLLSLTTYREMTNEGIKEVVKASPHAIL